MVDIKGSSAKWRMRTRNLLFSGVGTMCLLLQALWLHRATACHTTSSLGITSVSLLTIAFTSAREMSSNSSLSNTCRS